MVEEAIELVEGRVGKKLVKEGGVGLVEEGGRVGIRGR